MNKYSKMEGAGSMKGIHIFGSAIAPKVFDDRKVFDCQIRFNDYDTFNIPSSYNNRDLSMFQTISIIERLTFEVDQILGGHRFLDDISH